MSNPIRPIASDVSLQCDIELSPLDSDIPVTVKVIRIGPNSMVPVAINQAKG